MTITIYKPIAKYLMVFDKLGETTVLFTHTVPLNTQLLQGSIRVSVGDAAVTMKHYLYEPDWTYELQYSWLRRVGLAINSFLGQFLIQKEIQS